MDAPTHVSTGSEADQDTFRRVAVVDAKTGERIAGVIEADAVAGTVRRFDVDADGQIVRKGDSFAIVDEEREIRIAMIGEIGAEIVTLDSAEPTPATEAEG